MVQIHYIDQVRTLLNQAPITDISLSYSAIINLNIPHFNNDVQIAMENLSSVFSYTNEAINLPSVTPPPFSSDTTIVTPYDFNSIMHYWTFYRNGTRVMTRNCNHGHCNGVPGDKLWYNYVISSRDAETVINLYDR